MEEFDFDLNNEIGTSVSQLKNNRSVKQIEPVVHTDTDFDYDKVMEHFNSEQINTPFNYDSNRDAIINTMSNTLTTEKKTESFSNIQPQPSIPHHVNENRPRKQQNMNKFVRDLETNLDNFSQVNLHAPLPVNFTKQMIPKQIISKTQPKAKIIETMENNNIKKPEPVKEQTFVQKILNFIKKIEIKESIILMLVFMVLNNKVIIEFIYNKIPYIQTIQSPYPNLLIRTFVFGIFLIIIKNFNV